MMPRAPCHYAAKAKIIDFTIMQFLLQITSSQLPVYIPKLSRCADAAGEVAFSVPPTYAKMCLQALLVVSRMFRWPSNFQSYSVSSKIRLDN